MLDRYHIRASFRKFRMNIKDFLLSDKSREFFVFLFFFFIAGGFWLLQTLNVDYEAEFTVPVKLKGIPNEVVIIEEPAKEVHVRVKDKGTVLLNYMLGKSFYPLTVDFKEYSKGRGTHIRIHTTDFEKKLTAQFNASTQLISLKPDTLELLYSTGVAKKVPVRLNGKVEAGRQYYLTDTIFRPDSVLVYATSEVLDTLQAAYTERLTISDVSDTLQQRVLLEPLKGVKFEPHVVDVVFPVDIYTEKTVEVPLEGVDFPSGKVLRAFPSKVQVTFQVGMSRFRKITEADFQLYVSYEELLRLGSDKYPVRLHHVPEGVMNIRIHPSQVDFLIEQVSADYED